MKHLKCSDVGGGACTFVGDDETDEGAVKKVADHAMEAHPEMAKDMTEEKKQEWETMATGKVTED